MQDQELFQGYEVKNWDFSPRIYKILAVSAIFNILALLVVAQSNLLTTKGCDSPLVGGVCQVLDTLYVSGTVLTTDSEYVNKDFTKTELENAEIIWIDQTGVDKFKYPEGYYALSNPELSIPTEIPIDPNAPFPDIPGINSSNPPLNGGASLIDKAPVLPKSNPKAVVTDIPTDPLGNFGVTPTNPTRVKTKRTDPFPRDPKINQKNPTIPDSETADKDESLTGNKDEIVTNIEINKAPLKTFAADVKTKFEKKEIDLSQNFKIVADGVLTKEGKLDVTVDKKTKQPKSRVILAEGNEQMIEVAKQAIAAIGDSGWLRYLRDQGVEKINFTVAQDNDNLQVIITSDFPTNERAKGASSALSAAISIALLADRKDLKKLGEDEKTLLSNAKTTVNPQNDKQFVLNFVLPKATALEMITRKLNEPVEAPPEAKPNGSTAQIKENKTNTAK
jgi:hypothetical protein